MPEENDTNAKVMKIGRKSYARKKHYLCEEA